MNTGSTNPPNTPPPPNSAEHKWSYTSTTAAKYIKRSHPSLTFMQNIPAGYNSDERKAK
jgi:hypothetical protein